MALSYYGTGHYGANHYSSNYYGLRGEGVVVSEGAGGGRMVPFVPVPPIPYPVSIEKRQREEDSLLMLLL